MLLSFTPKVCFALVFVPVPLEHGTHVPMEHTMHSHSVVPLEMHHPGSLQEGLNCLTAASVAINSLYMPEPSQSASATSHQVMPSQDS